MRRSWRVTTIVLVAAALASAGCQPRGPEAAGGQVVDVPTGTVSVQQLAGRLGLDVVEVSDRHAFCRNAANTVMVFADPDGQAFVNGKPAGPAGGVVVSQGILFVPDRLEGYIRSALRSARRAARRSDPPQPRRRARRRPARPAFRIVIDPGHGGKDPGAISCLGFHEKSVNLAVGQEVARLLTAGGAAATLTRRSDRSVALDGRAALANRLEAHLLVSIHADSCRNASARGSTVYVSRSASARSFAAAEAISRALARTGLASRGVRRADFRVLLATRGPAVLVELGYLSNVREAALLGDAAFRRRLARAVAGGIRDYLGTQ